MSGKCFWNYIKCYRITVNFSNILWVYSLLHREVWEQGGEKLQTLDENPLCFWEGVEHRSVCVCKIQKLSHLSQLYAMKQPFGCAYILNYVFRGGWAELLSLMLLLLQVSRLGTLKQWKLVLFLILFLFFLFLLSSALFWMTSFNKMYWRI